MNNPFDNTTFFNWLWKHKLTILIVEIIAVAASIVFTSPYFMTPEFESCAVVYPSNIVTYSGESATEQLMQFLSSVDIKNEVIKDFNLVKHYKIDTTDRYWYTSLLDEYDQNVAINSTEYNAIKIRVLDKDPDLAYKMVNDIIKVLNRNILDAQREKSMETANSLKMELDKEKRGLDSLLAASKIISVQYGLLDYSNQSRELEKAYYQMLSASKSGKAFDEVSNQIKNLEEKDIEFQHINQHLWNRTNNYDEAYAKYRTALKEANKQITFTNVIARPYRADRAAYPVRWLYALLAFIGALVFSVIGLKVAHAFKK